MFPSTLNRSICKSLLADEENAPILVAAAKEQSCGQLRTYGATTTGQLANRDNDDTEAFSSNDIVFRNRYPVGVYFLLASKFFESFAANGIRSILALFLRDAMNLSEDLATVLLHVFNFFSQFCPILGALLADCYTGKVKSIFSFMVIYLLGFAGITLSTIQSVFVFDGETTVSIIVFVSLLLISFGNGSIRATITSLGSDQFRSPEQHDRYSSHYYFCYTAGMLLSKTITPSVRGRATCVGRQNCYFAVFSVLSCMFLLCFLIFTVGIPFYRNDVDRNRENLVSRIVRCICTSLRRKLFHDKSGVFLDNCIDDYGHEFVDTVKCFVNMIKLFLPLPIYWALYGQIDTKWTFQATKLNCLVFGWWRVEPDQVKAVAPLMLLALIPLWDNVLLKWIRRSTSFDITSLASVTLGGIAASAAFICAGFLEISIYSSERSGHSVSVLWQLPQFFLMMMGELLLAIPGLQFAIAESPPALKSVLTAFWFINNAFGNLIVVFITELHPVQRQSLEYFLYAALMLVGISVFTVFARSYDRLQAKNDRSVCANPTINDKL